MEAYYRKERIDRGIKARCEDIYALLSWKEIIYIAGPRVIPIVLMFSMPLLRPIVGDYWERVFFMISLMSILAISWELLSCIGLISLGQSMFFGIGAYLSGIINLKFDVPVPISIICASFGGGLLSTLLLIPASRIKGIYFVMITLCMPMFIARIIEATGIAGGTSGLSGIDPIGNYYIEMYAPVIILVVSLFSLRRLMATDYGLIIRGIRDNELSVMASGINIYHYKFMTIFIASVIGCFAGSYMAHYYQFVGISAFSLDYSIIPLTCAILGGFDSFAGSVLGAFVIVPLSESLRVLGTLRISIYSVALILFLLLLPEGIFHYIQRKYHQFERWKKISS